MNTTRLLGVMVVSMALFALRAPAQQEIASETKSWSFTMPAGWEFMSPQQLDKIKKQYKVRDPDDRSRVVAGFVKSGGLFAYPQVLVQVLETDMSNVSWRTLDRMIQDGYDESAGTENVAVILEMVGSSGAEDCTLDRNAKTLNATGSIVMDDQSVVPTASRAFLYHAGAIQLTGLDYKTNEGGAQRSLDAFAGSFHFAPGREFVAADKAPPPRPSRSAPQSSGGHRARYYYGGGFVGIGGLGLLLRMWLRSWAEGD
jgi:hypothetical protein